MKAKIILLIGAVALVTLSFTFSLNESPATKADQSINTSSQDSAPVGGFIADEITR